jgi:hypothetical protein
MSRPPAHLRGAGTAARPSRLTWKVALVLFAAVCVVQGVSPDVQITDSRMTVPTAYALVRHHTLYLNGVPSVARALAQTQYDIVRRGGHILPLYPWPPMLFAVPGAFLAGLVGVHVGTLSPSAPNHTWIIEVPSATVLVALTTLIVALIAMEFAGFHPRARRFGVWMALIFAFGTAAWSTASRALWQHTPAMLMCSLALLAALRVRRDRRYLWLLGAALPLGYLMRPTMAIPMIIIGLWALVTFRTSCWRMIVPAVIIAIGFVGVNEHYYGSLLAPYYTGSGNSLFEWYGPLDSIGVQLVSPSRGLFVYTPMFLLLFPGVRIRYRDGKFNSLDGALLVTVVAYTIAIILSGSTAGTAYGARFFTDIVPILLYFCFPVFERLIVTRDLTRPAAVATVAVTVLSGLITIPGAVSHGALCWSATPRLITDDPGRVWDWNDPQFLRPARLADEGASLHTILLGSCPATTGRHSS